MGRDDERGIAEGLNLAAGVCDKVAGELDEAASHCKARGTHGTSDIAGASAFCAAAQPLHSRQPRQSRPREAVGSTAVRLPLLPTEHVA